MKSQTGTASQPIKRDPATPVNRAILGCTLIQPSLSAAHDGIFESNSALFANLSRSHSGFLLLGSVTRSVGGTAFRIFSADSADVVCTTTPARPTLRTFDLDLHAGRVDGVLQERFRLFRCLDVVDLLGNRVDRKHRSALGFLMSARSRPGKRRADAYDRG
ncbi:hypothetical protein EVAR_47577_1 [Eumeta japonica]|uniref:Uncharacterized protein n=1 Tax=Eumeta variegata TaxID=151549 RepID=A0A4C1WQW0_EUMVA|nr:hypothetical protein EVAR_47577_1 [Eumeta japonica]